MKIAVVFTNDKRQLVLTPENEYETALVKMMFPYRSTSVGEPQYKLKANLHLGSFYDCQGGWFREGKDDDSLIFVFEKDEPKKEPIIEHQSAVHGKGRINEE